MPPAYFEQSQKRYPQSDMSALRVFLALRTAARRIDTVVAGWLEHSNMTLTKLDVLHLLASARPKGTTIGGLRDFLKMTQPNVTFVMKSLERDKLVKRTPDPADLRISIFSITTAGLACIDQLTPRHLKAIEAAVRPLSDSDRTRLIEMLAALAESFEVTPAPSTQGGILRVDKQSDTP